MKNEKYNPQGEVKSDDALNCEDAEKLVKQEIEEQETEKKKIIASQLGLKIDSPLVRTLSYLEKDQRDNIIAALSNQATAIFGKRYAKKVISQIFKSLNYQIFAEHIKTPEDFCYYANKVMEVARLYLKQENGKVKGQERAADSTASTIDSATWLIRGDFNRDLDTMLQMIRDNPSPDQYKSVIDVLSSIRGLIHTSEDLKRIGQFVKRLSEKGLDAKTHLKTLFGKQFIKHKYGRDEPGNYIYEQPNEQFKAWQEIIIDSKKLDTALSIMESAFAHGANPRVFVNGIIGRRFIQEATPKQLKQLEKYLSTLSDQVITTFKHPSYHEDDYAKKVISQIFKSLNYQIFAEHIKTPEDFYYYANKVMEVARLYLKQENGEVKGQERAADYTASTIDSATWLIRGDFNRDLDTMLQMMRDNPSPDQYESVIDVLSSIRGLIHTSEDLKRIGQFVKRLSKKGLDTKTHLKTLFGKQFKKHRYVGIDDLLDKYTYEPNEQFKAWQEIIIDSEKLDNALSIMESAFAHGANPEVSVKKLEEFVKKLITTGNLALLQNCNFQKDGLAIFTTLDAQKKWLEYCTRALIWQRNLQNIKDFSEFFNEALSLKIKTTSKKKYKINNIKGLSIDDELTDIQENVDEELGSAKEIIKPNEKLRAYALKLLKSALDESYRNKKFEAIIDFQSVISIPKVQKRISLYAFSLLTFGRMDVRHSLNLDEISEDDYKNAFEIAKRHSQEWQDEQTIIGPFEAGVKIFGYKRMLEYIKREDLSLHDAIHAFRDVLELFRTSGLSESEFYGQILQQVLMDDRKYPEGTAHHHLNTIAQTANKNVAKVIAKVQEYKEIKKLQELAATFNTPQAVFASWINLKKYSELEQLLGQTKVLNELKELRAEGKEKLYKYIETLAFHPDSKINMGAVIQFWRNPESFLSAEASHTPHEVHDKKKPSNYLNMPNLDLTASELRDALVEGKMDRLSAFTPLEIRYTIPLEDIKSEPLHDLVNKALGSSKKGVEGAARNSRKLFSELNKLLKPHGISVIEYIQGKPLSDSVNLPQGIEALLYNRDFGMERPLVKIREFVARINQKSDPEGAIAGDDTVNCMPFGDGKNTVYTFNPNTAQFVIRVVKDDGKERTIAQSVLTKDMDIKILVPDVISKLQKKNGHLEDILPVDILTNAPVYVACDNVEVTPNYKKQFQQIIEVIFRDFFKEYMSRYAKTERLNPKKVLIGQEHTDALSQLPTEVNTFVPQAPVSYSDKTGANVYMLDLESNARMDLIWQKQIRETKVERRREPPLPKIKGLGYLTFEDALKTGYLEGKGYRDDRSWISGLSNMENGLIAKDINNAAKERPNMSLKYTDDSGRMCGYVLAWEGRLLDKKAKNDAWKFYNQPCIYFNDIVSDRENRMAGGRLIQGFVELYKQNYLIKKNLLPIYALARESTSYQIIKKQLDKLGKDAGFDFELVELPTYEVGKDIMHPIIIHPVLKKK